MQPNRVTGLEHDSGRVRLSGGKFFDPSTGELVCGDIDIEGGRLRLGASPDSPAECTVDISGTLVLPGLVNAHTHSYGMLGRRLGAELPLEPWMSFASAITINRPWETAKLSATLHAIECLQTGAVAILDQLGGELSTWDAALSAYEEIGIRAALAPQVADLRAHESVGLAEHEWPTSVGSQRVRATDLIQQNRDLMETWEGRSELLRVFVGPSAPQRCSEELLLGLRDLAAEHSTYMHLHCLESRVQANLTAPHGSWVAYLDSLGVLGERTSLAHCVWLSEGDREILSHQGTAVVHNPHSNLQLGSGVADIPSLRRKGVRLALGSDGGNCGGSMDMVEAMRLAMILHRPGQLDPVEWETPRSVLAAATTHARTIFGWEHMSGVEDGAPADLAIFPLQGTPFASGEDPLGNLLLNSFDHRAQHVFVAGRQIVNNYRVTTVDQDQAAAEAADSLARIVAANADVIAAAEVESKVLAKLTTSMNPPRPVLAVHDATVKGIWP